MRCTLSGVNTTESSPTNTLVSLIHIALCVSALIIYHSTHVWYMKVVLGFVLIRSEYRSVSLGSFSCHCHSSYFQWSVPRAYCRVCVWVLFCLSQFEKFIGSINTSIWCCKLIFVVLLTKSSLLWKVSLQLFTLSTVVISRRHWIEEKREWSAMDSPDCHTERLRDFLLWSSLPHQGGRDCHVETRGIG